MDERKDSPTTQPAQAADAAPAAGAPPAAAESAPVKIEAPATVPAAAPLAAAPQPALVEAPRIDLSRIEPLNADAVSPSAATSAEPDMPAAAEAARFSAWSRLPMSAHYAAGVSIVVALSALTTLVTVASTRAPAPPPANFASAETARALQDSVAHLTAEVATLKTALAAAQRSASAQSTKLGERIDRAEKAQAEPAARIAKLSETVERLDHRQQQLAAAPPRTDVTGSVTPKDEAQGPVVEGWRLRDYYAGRAVVESRAGALFEVGPGSSLPGLGRVETIKRENGRVLVVTRNGVIAATLETRRPGPYLPYRY